MKNPRSIVAIAYDFDGTLAPGNMQERDFIPELQMGTGEFWNETKSLAQKHDMDEILAYMYLMLRKANEQEVKIDVASFRSFGAKLNFFPGVTTWFDRVNRYAAEKAIQVEHYIISSGLREMILGTSIAENFRYVFASSFMYDQHDVARWPALAVNYTNKTQFLFRINKGIQNCWDNSSINKFTNEIDRRVPFQHMIYIGDGETDIPAMKMTRHQGGMAVAVYPPEADNELKNRVERLVRDEDRADVAAPADYNKGKPLERVVFATLDRVAANAEIRRAATY